MQRVTRYALAAVAVLFVAGVAVQFFLAGIGLFGAGSMQLHIDVGWALHLVPLIILLLLWPARVGRRLMWLSIALFVVVAVQPFLPGLREAVPLAAALHPVNALAIFWLGLRLAQGSVALARSAPATPEPSAIAQEA
jgi:hypothetical protein